MNCDIGGKDIPGVFPHLPPDLDYLRQKKKFGALSTQSVSPKEFVGRDKVSPQTVKWKRRGAAAHAGAEGVRKGREIRN